MNYSSKRWAVKRSGIIIPVFFLSLSQVAPGQFREENAVSLALGGCHIQTEEAASPSGRPAGLALRRNPQLTIRHYRPFILRELGISSILAVLPVNTGSFGLEAGSYGIPGFRYFHTSLSYGAQLSEKLLAGIGISWLQTFEMEKTNPLWILGMQGGVIYTPTQKMSFMISVINPASISNYSEYGPVAPASIISGMAFRLQKDLLLMGEYAFEINSGKQVRLGIEYSINKLVFLRAGFHNAPEALSFGAGIYTRPLKLDLGISWNTVPGLIPGLDLTYIF